MRTKLRAGIIGRTGRGNYGHGLDIAYQGVPEVEVVAAADPDPEGLEAAGIRTGADRLYADYREMLETEDLDLVNVCPRWPDCHAEMVIAAAESGARGILMEKPMARTLAEADAMLDACGRHGVRMAVAHRRANAYERHGKKLVDEGAIGDVQVIRSHGKADHRSGAQDLMVLGTHMLDSTRYFAGSDVAWAYGHVTQDGRDVSRDDIREGDEEIGLLAGNGVAAYYAFENGVTAHFESYPTDLSANRTDRWFGFEVYGTEGIISFRDSPFAGMYVYPYGQWIPGESHGKWERVLIDEWEKRSDGQVRSSQERLHLSNQVIANELVKAVREERDVVNVSSGEDGRAALEMIMAVHESQLLGTRVYFPVKNRANPYQAWLEKQE
jgi:predicted dehydrogenase